MAVALFVAGVALILAFCLTVWWPLALLSSGVGCLVAAFDLGLNR